MPKRERYLFVCTNERPADSPKGSCGTRDAARLLARLKATAVQRGLRKRVRVCQSGCLDLCWAGAAVAVMPDHVFYGGVTEADVDEIVDSLEHGTLVERLLIPEALFDEPATTGGGATQTRTKGGDR